MRTLLRNIREVEVINRFVRFVLKSTRLRPGGVVSELQKRWPTFGFTDCEFRDIKFTMYNECDDALVYYFYYNVKYPEDADLFLFSELAKSSNCALDIGAHTGLFSVISSKANPQLRIHAFEPFAGNSNRLKINLDANRSTNVRVVPEAMGDRVGELEMTTPANIAIAAVASVNHEFAKSIHPGVQWETTTVPVNTIDNFRKQLDSPIDLIKCDVETYEMSVFRGASNTLTVDKPTIIFECFMDNERRVFFDGILNRFDYYLYLIHDDGIAPSPEGFPEVNRGFNFLITPVKPTRDFIGYNQADLLREIMLRSSRLTLTTPL